MYSYACVHGIIIQELLSIIQISALDNYNQFNILYIHTYTIGHKGVVELLLNHGSDPEHRNKAGCTPLMLAARYVCIYIVHLCNSMYVIYVLWE